MEFYDRFEQLHTNLDPICSKFETEMSYNRFDPRLMESQKSKQLIIEEKGSNTRQDAIDTFKQNLK